MNRNGEIELMRFVLAMMIVNFHSDGMFGERLFCAGGHIGVEFFFILSGFFLSATAQKQARDGEGWREINRETYGFMYRRLKSFYPETIIACLIACAVFLFCPGMGWNEYLRSSAGTMLENALCLRMSGLLCGGYNFVTWYLSTLLLCTAVLYPLLRRWGGSLLYMVFGLLLMGAVYTYQSTDGCDVVGECAGGMLLGNVRGMGEMMLGASLYPVVQMMQGYSVSRGMRMLMTLVKYASALCLVLSGFCIGAFDGNIGIVILAISMFLVISMSDMSFGKFLFGRQWVMWLGKFSLPLYLSHVFYARLFGNMLTDMSSVYTKLLLYNCCAWVTAMVVMYVAQWFRSFPSFFSCKTETQG